MRGAWTVTAVCLGAVAVFGCKAKPPTCGGHGDVPPAAEPQPAKASFSPAPWLMGAKRVATMDGTSGRRVVAAGRSWVRVFDATGASQGEANGVGMAQALHVADVDADGSDDIVVGRGRGRGVMSAPSSVVVYLGGSLDQPPERIPLPRSSRAQVVAIDSHPRQPGVLVIGSFVSKYMVAIIEATRTGPGAWSTRELGRYRVTVSVAWGDLGRDGTAEVIAARAYGETKEQPGDAFVVGGAAEPERLPTVGGARAVATTDGGATVVVAEGWHFRYGHEAKALLVAYDKRSCGWNRRVLAHVAGRHGYSRVRVADVDGDGTMDVLATGDGPGIYTPMHGRRVTYSFGREVAFDAVVADLDADRRPEVIVVGKQPGIWRFSPGS